MDNFDPEYIDEKYFYFYKHVDATFGSLEIIKSGTLKFTQPKGFNDPFDCQFSFDSNYFSSSKALKRNEKLFKNKMSPAQRVIEAHRMQKLYELNPDKLSKVSDLGDRAFICCLNQNPLNMLMWSHYAQQHKGFLIEFKFKFTSEFAELYVKDFMPFPIIYKDEYPTLSKGDGDLGGVELVNKCFLTKSPDWSYEKEYRVIRYGKYESEIQTYPRNLILSSVIAGVATSEPNFEMWGSVISETSKEIGRDIKLFRAEKINNQYAITVPDHPRLDLLEIKGK
jgi:hypothetical protein